MKNFLPFVILIILCFSCKKDNPKETYKSDCSKGEFSMWVDDRIELLSVVQHFTTWAAIRHTKYDVAYKHEVDSFFSAYSNHRAVSLCQQFIDNHFAYDAPAAFVLYHNHLPGFEQNTPYTDYLINRAGSKSKLEDFAEALKDFAEESDFLTFYNAHKEYYDSLIAYIEGYIPDDIDYIDVVENYYGSCKLSYNLIAAPLFHAGGYGPEIETDSGKHIFSIQGPSSSKEGIPVFGDKAWFEYVTLHEFSHSFVNPTTSTFNKEIYNSSELFTPIEKIMKQQNYSNWETCVNEHLVRTNVARMNYLLNGEKSKNKVLQNEYNQGFIYIYQLDTLMQRYENNRDLFPTYDSFYQEIVSCFNTMKSK